MLRAVYDRLTRPFGRPDRRRDWERRGLVGPVRVMNRRDAAGIGRDFREQHERSGIASTRNRHVDLPVLAALLDDPGIWRLSHEVLGDRLLLWRTNMFLGNPDLPWHEDRYAGLFVRAGVQPVRDARDRGQPARQLHRVRPGLPPVDGRREGAKIRDRIETAGVRQRSLRGAGRGRILRVPVAGGGRDDRVSSRAAARLVGLRERADRGVGRAHEHRVPRHDPGREAAR